MRFGLPNFKIEEKINRLLKEQTGQIVAQVMNEVSGSNFALEIKDMVVEELESKLKTLAQETFAQFLDQFKDDLIKQTSTNLIEPLGVPWKQKNLTIRVSQSLYQQVDLLARAKGVNKSQLMREAVQVHCNNLRTERLLKE